MMIRQTHRKGRANVADRFFADLSSDTGMRVTQTTGQELPKRQTLPCAGVAPNSVKSRGKGGKITGPSWHGVCDSLCGRLSLEF
jgi:hypothetical protein